MEFCEGGCVGIVGALVCGVGVDVDGAAGRHLYSQYAQFHGRKLITYSEYLIEMKNKGGDIVIS